MSTLRVTNIQNPSAGSPSIVLDSSGGMSGAFPSPNRNLLYNGAMQVAQRGTSVAAISAEYNTADRWSTALNSLGVWTQSVENDAPTGSGFRKSLKMLVTTADAAPAAGDYAIVGQALEGQDLQRIAKGTSSAQQLTLSFWTKSNATGTYIVRLVDADNSRNVSASYTISASATWERKTITFPADTTGSFDNDNALSLRVQFWLGAGSTYTSGSLQTTWAAAADSTAAVGQTNLAAATNNYWQITGVQLEVGPVATSFEFKSFGQELRECRRYYWRQTPGTAYGIYSAIVIYGSQTLANVFITHPGMRAAPNALEYSSLNVTRPYVGGYAVTSLSIAYASSDTTNLDAGFGATGAAQGDSGGLQNANNTAGYLGLSAEL